MKQEKINALLKALNSKRTGYRAGWVEGHCPLAPWKHTSGKDTNPSFGIKSSDKKKSICKCLSCGFGGDLMDLLMRLGQLQKKDPHSGYNMTLAASMIANEFEDMEIDPNAIPEYGDEKEKTELIFPETWLASFHHIGKFDEATQYVKGRGLTDKIIEALDLRYDPVQRRIGFPFRNFKGQLMGIQGRAIDKETELRYYQYGYQGHRNMHCWMGEDHLDLDQPVVLLEGPFDYTSVFRVYQNVAASFTSGLSVEKVKRLADASEIITFYDHGSGGDAARAKIKEVLKGTPITHLIPTKEQDDAGAMSLDTVAKYLGKHVKLRYFDE